MGVDYSLFWKIIPFFFLFLLGKCEAKIYDCFLFFNEFEVLKIRFAELYDHVDYFVIAEATETFQGSPKPLYFQEYRHLYSQYEDKIIYIPLEKHYETTNPWHRETYQRNLLLRGLKKCESTDLILLSDLDEIPKAGTITQIEQILETEDVVFVEHRVYRYHLNRFDPLVSPWLGTVASYYLTFRQSD